MVSKLDIPDPLLTADIIRRQRAEDDFKIFFDLIPDLACIASTEGHFLKINSRWQETLGYTEQEILATPFLDLIHPDDRDATMKEVARQLAGQETMQFINRYRCQDGSYKWLEWKATPAVGGKLLYASARDITARRAMEDELQESHRLLYEVQQLSRLGGWKYDCATGRMSWTEEVYRIYGVGKDYDMNDVKNDVEFYPPGDKQIIERAFWKAVNDAEPYDLELRFTRLDGEPLWVRTLGKPTLKNGKVVGVTGNIIDITEKKRAEEALAQERQFLAAILDNIGEAVVSCNGQGLLTRFNQAARKLHGLPEQSLPPEQWAAHYDLYHSDGVTPLPKEKIPLFRALQGETVRNAELRVIPKGGKARTLIANSQAMTDADGKLLGAVAAMHDITAQKEAEQKLARYARDMGERVKEISCLHDITLLLTHKEWSVEHMLDACVRRMPAGWLDPVHTCARIRFGDQVFTTPDFCETAWKLEAVIPFVTQGVGYVEVFYSAEKAEKDPFLAEERDLINSIARMVAQALERRFADEEMKLQRDNFMRILDAITDGIYVVSQNFDIEYINPVIEREFGKVEGRKCYTYFHDRNEVCPWCKNPEVFEGKTVRWEWYSSKTGKTYDLLDTPIKNPDGSISKFEIFHDITERKRMEDELRQREEKYSQLFNNMVQGVFYQQADGALTDVNAAALAMFGMTRDEFLGKTSVSYDWKFIDEQGAELPGKEHPSMLALSAGKVMLNKVLGVYNHLRNDYVWVSVTAIPQFRPGDKKPYQAFVTLHDITELKHAEAQIRVMAFFDTLTQLPNRRLLHDRMEQAMAASKRSKRYCALLLFFDLDNFKPLNDLYGHDVGDMLLVEVARRAGSCVREVDTVARFGGDEFVVMLSELDQDRNESVVQAGSVAEKLRTLLSEPYHLSFRHQGEAEKSVTHHCAASIGVALFLDHEIGLEDILKRADSAMYLAKEEGRNRVHFHKSDATP